MICRTGRATGLEFHSQDFIYRLDLIRLFNYFFMENNNFIFWAPPAPLL